MKPDRLSMQYRCNVAWAGERKDGTQIQAQLSANFVRDTSGAPVATMASFINITGRTNEDVIGHTVGESIPGTEYYWIINYGRGFPEKKINIQDTIVSQTDKLV